MYTINNLEYFLENKLFCDITLLIENKKISAHKIILAACSDYFKAMFTSNFKENTLSTITINCLDYNAIKKIIKFCYTNELNFDSVNECLNCMIASDYLIIPIISNICEEYLLNNITLDTFYSIHTICELYNLNINKTLFNFLIHNIVKLSENNNFVKLSYNTIYNLLNSDDLNIPNEDFALFILTKWLDYNNITQKTILELYNTIRVKYLSNYQQIQYLDKIVSKKYLRPRYSTTGTLYSVNCYGEEYATIERFSLKHETWEKYIKIPDERTRFNVVSINEFIFIIGGYKFSFPINSVIVYNTITNEWRKSPSLLQCRSDCCSVVINNIIYTFGGRSNNTSSILNTVESLDITMKELKWRSELNMPIEKSNMGIVALHNKIYIIGGIISFIPYNKYTNSVESYDIIKKKWVNETPITIKANYVSATCHNNKIYAICNVIQDIYISEFYSYDVDNKIWTQLPLICVPKQLCALISYADDLYSVGGFHGSISNYKYVEKYNLEKQKWITVKETKINKLGNGCFIIKI
ncbi:BTB kelch-domain protein [Eptesipox virus]|uniref:BTB kelch-domain protein n=1 Tax=Eptesipox virus TaxID=1329402 RepID=A0A220T6K9_9POXV|nr:BTB kelch-domain protein [Eptesipox virus]ASK51350.1 BTB kelch-domain protein [Eptesipox virus]WAH71108.1 BTB kelch-domain protein [Eptesipox virus]